MTIPQIVESLTKVSGLTENQAKTAVYYAMATHHMTKVGWFPALAFIGPPGTGKSKALDALAKLVYRPYRITCHMTMSPSSLRTELAEARNKTAIIEEGDLYPNSKQLQAYLINRVDRTRTSGVAIREQVDSANGTKEWKTRKPQIYGATILHDRKSIEDLAAESRAIVIPTVYRQGDYIDVPNSLKLPNFRLGSVPNYFNAGRPLDTWSPLIMAAAGQDDDDWLLWVWEQLEQAVDQLRDGQSYEENLAIFGQMVKAFADEMGTGFMASPNGDMTPLPLQSKVVEPLRKELPYIGGRKVADILRNMGFKVARHWGANKVFTTKEQLKAIAKKIGYEDEAFNN